MRVKCLVIAAAAFIVSAACFAEPIPKYLELARELVATVKPENNKYSYTGSNGVRLKGDLFASENSVNTMCSGFVTAMLERTDHPAIKAIKSKGDWINGYLRVDSFYRAVEKEYGLSKIADLRQLQPGDILVMRCLNGCFSSQGSAQGHVALVDSFPESKEPGAPRLDGTSQWTLQVIDANDYPHDLDDTRRVPGLKVTGVGRGTLRLYTDADGHVVAYTEGPNGQRLFTSDTRPVVFGRPQ
jgi:hypothetical protein